MQNRPKILVVEDTEKHMRDAIKAAKEFDIELVKAVNSGDALKKMTRYDNERHVEENDVDGVVTDLFMPLSDSPPWNHATDPVGVLVAVMAQRAGIPVVLCTAGYHHGSRYQWVNLLFGERCLKIRIVDAGNDYHTESETKNWRRAFTEILELNKASKATSK